MSSLPSSAPAPRILIVDDDVSVSDTFSRMLRLDGHEVWAALSCDEGLRLAERHVPDVIILDLRMPAASSLRILQAIRAVPALKDTPVAIVTGDYLASGDDVLQLERLGATLRYKPFWLDELVALAREMLTVSVAD